MAEKKFGNDTYRCAKLDAESGLRLLIRTTKLFGPASAVMSALTEADKSKAEALSLAGIAEFVSKLDEDVAIRYVKDVLGLCTVKGDTVLLDVHVQDLSDVFQICMWALEVQFRDFLGGTGASPLGRRAAVAA